MLVGIYKRESLQNVRDYLLHESTGGKLGRPLISKEEVEDVRFLLGEILDHPNVKTAKEIAKLMEERDEV